MARENDALILYTFYHACDLRVLQAKLAVLGHNYRKKTNVTLLESAVEPHGFDSLTEYLTSSYINFHSEKKTS